MMRMMHANSIMGAEAQTRDKWTDEGVGKVRRFFQEHG